MECTPWAGARRYNQFFLFYFGQENCVLHRRIERTTERGKTGGRHALRCIGGPPDALNELHEFSHFPIFTRLDQSLAPALPSGK
jgi:hypothetical protein